LALKVRPPAASYRQAEAIYAVARPRDQEKSHSAKKKKHDAAPKKSEVRKKKAKRIVAHKGKTAVLFRAGDEFSSRVARGRRLKYEGRAREKRRSGTALQKRQKSWPTENNRIHLLVATTHPQSPDRGPKHEGGIQKNKTGGRH